MGTSNPVARQEGGGAAALELAGGRRAGMLAPLSSAVELGVDSPGSSASRGGWSAGRAL